MPDGTVHGSFELNAEQPIRQLHSIRDAGVEADETLGHLGTKMDELGRKTARPRLQLSGVAEVNAQLSELEARLDRLDRRRAIAHVGTSGGLGGLVPSLPVNNQAGGGGGGFPLLSTLGGIGGRLPWWSTLLPFAGQLGGGAGALASSAGSAIGGAGVLGLGGAGALGPGLLAGGLMGKQAVTDLGNIEKAQTSYNLALKEFGRQSSQAITAKRRLDEAMAKAPPGAAGAARQVSLLQQDFRSATAPGYQAIYGGIAQGAYSLRRALPQAAPLLNTAAGVTANAGADLTSMLVNPQSLSRYGSMTTAFATDLPIAERSLQSIVRLFQNLAVDAIPFFHEGNVWVNNWTRNMANQSENTARVQSSMGRMVDSAKDWVRLLESGGHVLHDLFSPGVMSGDSLVVTFTHTLDRWDEWLKANPEKVRKFFSDGVQGTEKIATVIGTLSKDVMQIFTMINPLLSRAEDFLKFVSGVGGGNLLLGGALAYGGLRGLQGAGLNVPGLGGLAGSAVLGSPGPAARSMGVLPAFLGGGRGAGAAATTLEGSAAADIGGVRMLGAATPEALALEQAAQSGVARSGALMSQLGEQGSAFSRTVGEARQALGTIGGGVAAFGSGVARIAAPLALINGVLQASQPTSGGLAGRLQNFASGLTLGIIPSYTSPTDAGGQQAQAFLQQPGVTTADIIAETQAQAGRSYGPLPSWGARFSANITRPFQGDHAIRAQQVAGQQAIALGGAATQQLSQQAAQVTSPQQARPIVAQAGQLYQALSLTPQDQAKLTAQIQGVIHTALTAGGAASGHDFSDALTTALNRALDSKDPGKSLNRMFRTALQGVPQAIRDSGGPAGARAWAQNIADWTKQTEREYPKLRAPLEKFLHDLVREMNSVAGTLGTTWDRILGKAFDINGKILIGVDAIWNGKDGIWASLTDKAHEVEARLQGTWQIVQSDAINALKGMGFSDQQAKQIVVQAEGGGKGRANAGAALMAVGTPPLPGQQGNVGPLSPTFPKARGGKLGGNGLLDTVGLPDGSVGAPGEAWIANRHTMHELDLATMSYYGKTAWQIIRDEERMHSAPTGGGGGKRPLPIRKAGGVAGRKGRATGGALDVAAAKGGEVASYVFPFSGSGWAWDRTDQGVDFGGNSPVGAIGDFRVTYSNPSDGWYGPAPAFMVYQLTDGPDAGKYIYVAEHIGGMAPVGTTGHAGQAIAQMTGGIEMGWAAGPEGKQIMAGFIDAGQHLTAAGEDFHAFLIGLTHGQITGGAFGGSMGPAVRAISLKQRSTGLKGLPGAIADSNLHGKTAGLQGAVNKSIGAMGAPSAGGGPLMPGFQFKVKAVQETSDLVGNSGGSAYNLPLDGYSEMSSSLGTTGPYNALGGLPGGQLMNIGANGKQTQRRKVDVGAGSTGGEWTSHPRLVMGLYPAASSALGLYGGGPYLVDIGGAPGLNPVDHMARGGRVNWAGWNAAGGDFLTHGPTVFGVGEGGRRERVKIGPAHTGGGDGTKVTVNFNGPVNARNKQEVEQLAEMVGEKIIDALDRTGGGTSDHELIKGAA